MKPNNIVRFTVEIWRIRNFVLFTALEGLISFIFLLALPKSVNEVWIFGYSSSRILMMLSVFLLTLILVWVAVNLFRKPAWEEKLNATLLGLVSDVNKSELALAILSAIFIFMTFFIILWLVTKDNYYQGYLLRFSPILIFGMLIIIQTLALILLLAEKKIRVEWLGSFLFIIFLLFFWEYPLIIFNKLDNTFLISIALLATFYIQMVFRSSFWAPIKYKIGWVISIIAVALLLYVQLFFIPKKFLTYRQHFLILAPISFLFLVSSQQIFERILSGVLKSTTMRIVLYLITIFGLLYAGNLYYLAGKAHSEHINTTYSPNDDEETYMGFVIEAYETNFQYTGVRNQMPLYPFIQALFYHPNMRWDDFFIRGKQVNIFLSLASLIFIFFIALKLFSLYPAITLTLTTAFGLYVFMSGYFMVELFYYTLSSMAYLLLCLMLVKPSTWLGVMSGITLGLAHLSKASILPAFLLFTGVYVAKELFFVSIQLKTRSLNSRESQSGLRSRLTSFAFVVVLYFMVISPYIIESKRTYGSYFYNVNSTFYMWYDSYEEAIQGTMAHGDRLGWPNMPDEDIPSLLKYFREHNFSDIWERIRYGSHWQLENLRYQYGFFNYTILFMAFALILLSLDLRRSLQLLGKFSPLVLFSVLYFALYVFLYIWYSPIACLPRFVNALYVPLLFSVFAVAKNMSSDTNLLLVKLANFTLLVMICIDIWYIISQGPFNRDFGS